MQWGQCFMISTRPGVLLRHEVRPSCSQCSLCGVQVSKGKRWNQKKRVHHGGLLSTVIKPRASSRLVSGCTGSDATETEGSRMKETMADLDAILGIEEEEEEEEEEESMESILDPMVKEEVEKAAQEAVAKDDLTEQMTKVVEAAVKMADGKAGNEELRENVENLIESLNDVKQVPSEDIKKMKESVFGTTGYWVTEVVPPSAPLSQTDKPNSGDTPWITFKGNMRGESDEVFKAVDEKMTEIFGDKYLVFLEEEKDPDDGGDPRIVFKVYRKEDTVQEPGGWDNIFLWGLLVFSIVSATQLGVTANLLNLPKESLEYLAKPENYDSDAIPPGLENFDFTGFLLSSLPIAGGVLTSQFFHEAGHKIYAVLKGINIGPPFLIPNSQLGVFGAITQLRSPVRDRKTLWNFSFAGVALGGAVSLALFIYGLLAAQDPSVTPNQLVPVPTALLQGSLLLGTIIKAASGGAAVSSQSQILLHPMTVAGWCGLVTTSFNLLPVGRLDGGRLLLAAYGKDSLYASSIFVYAGLGLGVLGSSLALPFGLFVLICQREFEDKYRDQVTQLDQRRCSITVGLILMALLILFPVFSGNVDSNFGGMTL